MIRVLLFNLLLFGCGPRLFDCPKTSDIAIDIAKSTWPSSKEVLDRVDIFCEDSDPWPGAECVTWAQGSGPIPGQRAKYKVRRDLAGECIIHEAHHSQLYIDNNREDCSSHEKSCGWDALAIEEATAKYHQQIK